MPGTFWLASRATALGNGNWRYDYALQNTTSQVAARGLHIAAPCGTGNLSNAQFFGVRHHSGSPFSNAPWDFAASNDSLSWGTDPYPLNPEANAVRWGNLFAFSIESSASPASATARVQLFERAGTLAGEVFAPSPCQNPGGLTPSGASPPRRP